MSNDSELNEINNIRKKLKNEYELNTEDYYAMDVERALNDNWQIQRFRLAIDDNDESKAYKMLISALKWRKTYGLLDRNDDYYPKELYEINSTQVSGPDSEGRYILWNSGRNVKKPSREILPLIIQFIVHHIEKLDILSASNGMLMVTDFSFIGLANYDGEQVRQVNQILFAYYPGLLKYCYVINFPSAFIPFFKLFLMFLKKNMRDNLKLISMTEIERFVQMDVIPQDFGEKIID
ncbi:uncharacterized protein LOC128966478 [Oppia nitens]|uniref:uncharacterized protein LOC128966478 n=1 Tax=Oppia nitens TaxID=1686743 RepID=UPI0023DB3DFC|nr:uncharacterized protein LOC128966478 [Oppia nitens]